MMTLTFLSANYAFIVEMTAASYILPLFSAMFVFILGAGNFSF